MTSCRLAIVLLIACVPVAVLRGQARPHLGPPAVLRELLQGVPLLVSDTTEWSAYPRGDGRTLWIGAARVQPIDRSRTVFAIVDSAAGPRAWVIGTFTGFGSWDKLQRLLVNRDEVLVFDQYDFDYGWTRQRFVFWFDLERGMTLASRELRQAPRVGWGRRGGASIPMVLAGSRWVVAKGQTVGGAATVPSANDTLQAMEPDTAKFVGEAVTGPGSSSWVLAGDPTVVIEDGSVDPATGVTTGNGRVGQVTGSDTTWITIPSVPDSIRVAAWTWEGIYQDFDFNEAYGPPVRSGDRVFAGIQFEGGEGNNGVGGLLEYSIRGHSLVVHRWPEIIRRSAGTPLIDQDTLWLPLYHNGEYGTYGAGLLIHALTSSGARLIPFPDPIKKIERVGEHTLIDAGTSLGLLSGDGFRRWVVVPDAQGAWTALEVTTDSTGRE